MRTEKIMTWSQSICCKALIDHLAFQQIIRLVNVICFSFNDTKIRKKLINKLTQVWKLSGILINLRRHL